MDRWRQEEKQAGIELVGVYAMTHRSTWKSVERRHARQYSEITGDKYTRNPVSGRARGDMGDVTADKDFSLNVEEKYRDKPLPKYILDAIDQAEKSVQNSPYKDVGFARWCTKNERDDNDICMLKWKHLRKLLGWVNWEEIRGE